MFIKMLRAQCVLNSEIHLLFTLMELTRGSV